MKSLNRKAMRRATAELAALNERNAAALAAYHAAHTNG